MKVIINKKETLLNRLASQCHQLFLTDTFEADLLAYIFVCQGKKHVSTSPIGSMYGIYANIWGIYILMVNVTIYSIAN
jgi:hypothetical protein